MITTVKKTEVNLMLEKVSLSNLMPFIYADHEVTNIIVAYYIWTTLFGNFQSITGQHHKILFQEPKKYLLLTRDHIREATAYGAGGGYSLQIQVAVPLQTPYSSKRGGSGGYEGSASAGDSEVPIPVPV